MTNVITPSIGKTDELIVPKSCPPFAIISDISPFAEETPKPVLIEVALSYFARVSIPLTMRNFIANEDRSKIIDGMITIGIRAMLINAPIEIKNNAANTSLRGTVMTLAIEAVLDSATRTPAKNAPITPDNPNHLEKNAKPIRSPRISIYNNA